MRQSRQGGTSLLEVFLAMILLSLVIFAVVGTYPGATASLTRAHQMSVASGLAQQWIEQCQASPYGSINTMNVAVTPPGDSMTYFTTIVATTPINGDANLTQYQVTTTWNIVSSVSYTCVVYNTTNVP